MKTLKKSVVETITIDAGVCKGCRLCVDQCPKQVLRVSEERNEKGYLLPWVADISACIACLMCEMICPDMALEVILGEGGKDEK